MVMLTNILILTEIGNIDLDCCYGDGDNKNDEIKQITIWR